MHESSKGLPLTVNQIVAYNLRRAREQRGLTQEQAAERLEPHLGVRWSKASYSAAERSAERSQRLRRFSADEIVAFSAAFELPVTFFFLPPANERLLIGAGERAQQRMALAEYVNFVFGSPQGLDTLDKRLLDIAEVLPADELAAQQLGQAVQSLLLARIRQHRGELEDWHAALVGLEDVLRQLLLDVRLTDVAQEIRRGHGLPSPGDDDAPKEASS